MQNTTDNIGTNLKFKDRLFRILFTDKKYALELYNALNKSDYTDIDDLEVRTLEDVVWMKMKNGLNCQMHLFVGMSSRKWNYKCRYLTSIMDITLN